MANYLNRRFFLIVLGIVVCAIVLLGQNAQTQQNDIVAETKQNSDSEQSASDQESDSNAEVVEGMINIRPNMSLKDLVKTMSEITSEVYLLSDDIKDENMEIITPEGGFNSDDAQRIFDILLDMNEYSVVKLNGVNKIVPRKQVKRQSIPLRLDKDPSRSSHKYVMKLIKLKSVEVEDVRKVLRNLVSRDGVIKAYEPSNTLVLVDSEDNVNRIVEIINNLDYEKQVEFVKIKNTSSENVMVKLLEIFSPKESKSNKKTGSSRGSTILSGFSELLGFKVINDERTNSLIVIADPRDVSLIKDTIDILDVDSESAEHDVYVIPVRNADAEQILQVLDNLFSPSRGSGGISSSESPSLSSSSHSSNYTSINPRSNSNSSKSVLGGSQLGGSGALGSQGREIQRGVNSSGGSTTVISSEDGLRVTSDPATNSILMVGSLSQYKTVKRIVEKLDIRRKQVFVEAAILEVGLDNLQSLGTNFGFGVRVEGDNLGFAGQQLPGIPSLLGVAADPQTASSTIGSLSGLFLGIVGDEIDPDDSGPLPAIPSFSAVFQALKSVTDVNVLSTPSIITTDNEPAEIVVADVIPFPMGSTVGTSGVTVQTIERLPVGIRLSITPQISEGEYLNLDIITEVSSTREAPSGLNTAQFGIATTTRSADSSVIVKNGQTLVIGGLVQDREEVLRNKTPLLGDIPVLGNLFRFKRNQSRKLNLMILLTPRIIETEGDMKQLLLDYQKRKTLLHRRDLNTLE